MKHIITTSSFLLVFASIGQITITNADLPSSGDTVVVSITNSIGSVDPDMSGADVTWDFSTLVPNEQTVERFVAVSGTPIAYQFAFNNGFLYPDHEANVAQDAPDRDVAGMLSLTEVFNYFDNASPAYRQTGFGANFNGAPLPIRYDTIETIYELPMNYNDAYESKLYWEASIPSLGYFSQHKVIQNEVDGWGTLILPNGTYPVLKIKKTIVENDSVYVDQFNFGSQIPVPEAIEYHFMGAESIVPLLKVVMTGGNVTEARYKDAHDPSLSVEEIVENDFKLYPNPTNGIVNVSNIDNLKAISILDVRGKVYPININNSIDVSFLNSGVYFMRFETSKGQVYSEKLMIK
jgi:hypothetical protein